MMIDRKTLSQVTDALTRFPVVCLVGPRQVGKTTLARKLLAQTSGAEYLDLERPSDLARVQDAELFLGERTNRLVILDEVQQLPGLFPLLRALVDAHRVPGRFLLLGSASPELINRSSESLAGRMRLIEMTPLRLDELAAEQTVMQRLWCRGGFPNSFLAPDDAASVEWRESFVATFLERDVPGFGLRIPATTLRRFWRMLAHCHGQLWNGSTLARSLDVSPQAAGRYLDLLCDAFIARRLPSWHANTGKRLVKSPRVYLRDSGMLHVLLGIGDGPTLEAHPALGASWEGFVIEQILAVLDPLDAGFYRTQAGAEIDLVLRLRGHQALVGIEVKYSSAPRPARGFWNALDDLGIERAFVVYPGREDFPIEKRVRAWPALRVGELAALL